MHDSGSTCWTVVRGAAAGNEREQEEFGRRYLPVVRAYLSARWQHSPLHSEVEDATQEVFLACFRQGGALERVDAERGVGFRAFLYGVARNIARQIETKRARRGAKEGTLEREADQLECGDPGISTFFDRAWACSIVREAAERQLAAASSAEERRRVELLRLRFQDGLPIREIASRWDVEAAILHREYPKARAEFMAALLQVMAFHHPAPLAEVERECARLLDALA